MKDTAPAPSPSRLLIWTTVTARWALRLLVAAWLLLALSAAVLHFWIVPRIADYRETLQAQVTRLLGEPVRIGAISARSNNLFPSFELRDVVLHDAQQREALRLGRVTASLSPRSLWRFSFDQLVIDAPALEVRLDARGALYVAGLEVPTANQGDSSVLNWLFSQPELVIRNGSVRWTDERRGAPPLLLQFVDCVLSNGLRKHALRLDATPPPAWGARLSLRGQFNQPLLSTQAGRWRDWRGRIYADLPHVDISQIGQYIALGGAQVRQGSGALRVWADVRAGALTGVTADLSLSAVDATLAPDLQPLTLRGLRGRIAGHLERGIFEAQTQHLQFETAAGARWPGGNLWIEHRQASNLHAEQSRLRADHLDLALLAGLARSLPLDRALQRELTDVAPRGLVERINVDWHGPYDDPTIYTVDARLSALALDSQAAAPLPRPKSKPAGHSAPPTDSSPPLGRPGVRGVTIDLHATQKGGSADVSITQGALSFPGVFEDPLIALDQLSTRAQWTIQGKQISVSLPDLRFANADAMGQARVQWHTGDSGRAASNAPRDDARFPGILDLSGHLSRADATRVYRYLPQSIPKSVRDYVRDAVRAGRSDGVDFLVRGDLRHIPFTDPRQGDFRIAGRMNGVTYAYVPYDEEQPNQPSVWPTLTHLDGRIVFERSAMRVQDARGRIADAPAITFQKTEAQIPDMDAPQTRLQVDAQIRGPLGDALRIASRILGPSSREASRVLGEMSASGSSDYQMHLELPLEQMDQFKLQAKVGLNGNQLQVQPALPAFTQTRGSINFTETGFTLANVRARWVGGDTRIDGGGNYAGAGPQKINFRAEGSFDAEALRALRSPQWAEAARLGRRMTGAARYSAELSMLDGEPEFNFSSDLQGLGLNLPAPLVKAPQEPLALHIERKVTQRAARGGAALQDQFSFTLGQVASARYVRDLSGSGPPRVLAGSLALGQAAANPAAPQPGVLLQINQPRFDADAWKALFGNAADASEAKAAPAANRASDDSKDTDDDPSAYLPRQIVLRANEVQITGRRANNVVLGATREGGIWRINADSDALSGYAEYDQAHGGRLHARLARLYIARGEAEQQVESLLDESPRSLPALDIVVDDFRMHGTRLGHAEIDAVNLHRKRATREWRLNKLKLTTPEAELNAQGGWRAQSDGAQHMTLNFQLAIGDAGVLLTRLGMPDVLRHGKGRLDGNIGWRGSPLALDYPSMDGKLQIEVGSGQFLKAEPGLAKLLGVLSLQALPRRLTLNFSDIFSHGFAFDAVHGNAAIAQGIVHTDDLKMAGPSAIVQIAGSADLVRETQDLHVVVVPQLNAGAASLVATAINPAVGVGSYVAQLLLSKPLETAATQRFHIEGAWTDPKISKETKEQSQSPTPTPTPTQSQNPAPAQEKP
ncbi:MAG: TIGR02099 family protein [Burkholderiaceae bacterium]|jgi:uncharacterized protein (TIGR02099 family)|nr:TIGR02099 family protein [Burkholderiaceae bacterium]